MRLTESLLNLARLWAAAHDKSLARLGQIVAKDGKFFARVEAGKDFQVTTFERFLAFFRDPMNWPGGVIPADASDQLGQVQSIAAGVADDVEPPHSPRVTARDRFASSTKSGDLIRSPETAADNHADFIRAGVEVIEREGEADSHGPFSGSASTCSTTRAPSSESTNPACSTGAADA
jgi:hypothetical protein